MNREQQNRRTNEATEMLTLTTFDAPKLTFYCIYGLYRPPIIVIGLYSRNLY